MTTTQSNGRPKPPSLGKGLSELAHDFAAMSDLQMKLFSVDARTAYDRSRGPALALAIGLVLIVGAAPVLLLGAAYGLAEALAWPNWASCAVVAVAAIAVGLLTTWLAFRGLAACGRTFERSRREFRENVKWIQRAIRTHGRFEARGRSPHSPASNIER
jgi:hypothetical protein